MSKRICLDLTDQEHQALADLARREKRSVNCQASYIVSAALPSLKVHEDCSGTKPLGKA